MAAATVDLTSPITSSFSASRAWSQSGFGERHFRVIDFAEVNTAKGSTLAQNDTIDAVKIPAGSFVKDVIVRMLVPCAVASTTMQVGDSNVATGYIASVALDAAANTVAAASGTAILTLSAGSTVTTYSGGVYYATADAVRLKLNSSSAATTGKVEVSAFIIPLGTGTTI